MLGSDVGHRWAHIPAQPRANGGNIMKVKEAMHEGVEWRAPNTPLTDIAKVMKDNDVGAVPIGENDRLVGMVTDRDIACRAVAEARDLSKTTAGDVMTRNVIYCMENEEVQDAIRIMENKQVRRLPVINDEKRMVGMLSLGDLSHAVSHDLSGELAAAVANHHK
jgi:CBS domain-containing protein